MAKKSTADSRRKTSDPLPDNTNDITDDTGPLIRSGTAPNTVPPSTNTSRKSSFSSFFKGFGSRNRAGSQKSHSPPHSAGELYSRPRTPLTPGALERLDAFFESPPRTRSSSFFGSKIPPRAPPTHIRTRSSPAPVIFGPWESVADSLSLHSAAVLFAVELDQARERWRATTSHPAVTSEATSSQQAHLHPHLNAGHLRPSNENLSERRLSLFLSPEQDPVSAFSWSTSSSSSSNVIDTATEVGTASGRVFGVGTDLRPLFGRKNPKKVAKKEYPKPNHPNVLDKADTNKLNKFWDLSEHQAREEAANRGRGSAEHSAGQRSPYPGLHLHLPSISEHPVDVLGSLPRFKMDSSLLTPGSRLLADQADKQRRVKDAKDMYASIVSKAERSNTPLPPYDFIELIGKGAFGRVYKCRDQKSGNLVAVKITSIDDADFEGTVRDFQKEVDILQQLKSNKVKNVNVIHDAFDLHSQLWIVADYCTGGSIRTLLRAWEKNGKPQGLPEHFIIPIARELALALKGMHAMHIIHRDIKGANVYITEDGALQLGDFGIVGVIDDANSKRKTVIGTPHFMPKEMMEKMSEEEDFKGEEGYGTEVDIWAYGCTILEMATGSPPMIHLREPDAMVKAMETQGAPRLEGTQYSAELCDLVAFCLQLDPKARPTADAVLKHPSIAHSSKQYPTSSLVKLIEKFKIWEHGGGSRSSLWLPAPSDVARGTASDNEEQAADNDDLDDWNFSTSDDFDKRFSQMPPLQDGDLGYLQAPEGAGLPPGLPPLNTQNLSVAERIKREHSEMSANRGERSLARVFNTNDDAGYQVASPPMEPTPPADMPSPPSDLPLRNFTSNAPTRESMIEIDLNEADVNETATSTFALHMDAINENTIKPAPRKAAFDEEDDDDYQYDKQEDTSKRDTMAWTFPSAPAAPQPKRGTMDWSFSTAEPAQPEESSMSTTSPASGGGDDFLPGFRANLNRTATEPIGHFRDFSHDGGSSAASPNRNSVASMIDLDMGMVDPPRHLEDPAEIVRPSTASSAAGSTMTDMTSGNPFDLEDDPVQNEIDRNRFSYHKQWQSEGGRGNRNSHRTMQMHARGSSLASNESGVENGHMTNSDPGLGEPMAPSAVFESGLSLAQEDTNQWPNFSTFDSFDSSPNYLPTLGDVQRMGDTGFGGLDRNLRPNGVSTRSREPSSEPAGPEVDFPDIVAPDPNALHEDADPRLLEDEFGHVLADLATALTGVEQSLRQYANVDDLVDDDEPASDFESGFESNREPMTEDEGNADSMLTARRNKPRSRSPRQSQGENVQ
ncbi:hypothetical protein PRZ48_009569 [Zasmidium cellare]|uniref:non-specific serine/threonine protein kinase n=1 Tax=Zasmidium cellare TaxID=395010 RepID=A0ABR0EC35_ZASCE|nr:hypothetical protein PRZ48_009569 [Zasmidium cellare]